MRIITIPETGIRIGVTTAEEAYIIFFRLSPVHDLEFNGKLYKAGECGYTRSYFKQFFD